MKAAKFKTVDEYLAAVPPAHRILLKTLRKLIRETAPKAEEVISYNMPAFKYNGMLVYYASFADHCSLFPAGGEVFKQFSNELKNYKTSKGTIQFTVDNPLPDNLVRKIIKLRVRQNEEKSAQKPTPKRKIKTNLPTLYPKP